MRLRMKVSIMRYRDEAQDEGEYNKVQGMRFMMRLRMKVSIMRYRG